MPFESTAKMLHLKLPPEVRFACLYLEARGMRFCIDFGYQNAVAIATEIQIKALSSLIQ